MKRKKERRGGRNMITSSQNIKEKRENTNFPKDENIDIGDSINRKGAVSENC